MKIGDIVVPTNAVLASGSGRYQLAIVMDLNPFVLVSEDGDMIWTKENIENFESIGTASMDILGKVRKNLYCYL